MPPIPRRRPAQAPPEPPTLASTPEDVEAQLSRDPVIPAAPAEPRPLPKRLMPNMHAVVWRVIVTQLAAKVCIGEWRRPLPPRVTYNRPPERAYPTQGYPTGTELSISAQSTLTWQGVATDLGERATVTRTRYAAAILTLSDIDRAHIAQTLAHATTLAAERDTWQKLAGGLDLHGDRLTAWSRLARALGLEVRVLASGEVIPVPADPAQPAPLNARVRKIATPVDKT